MYNEWRTITEDQYTFALIEWTRRYGSQTSGRESKLKPRRQRALDRRCSTCGSCDHAAAKCPNRRDAKGKWPHEPAGRFRDVDAHERGPVSKVHDDESSEAEQNGESHSTLGGHHGAVVRANRIIVLCWTRRVYFWIAKVLGHKIQALVPRYCGEKQRDKMSTRKINVTTKKLFVMWTTCREQALKAGRGIA